MSELDGAPPRATEQAGPRDLVVSGMREMWNAVWTATWDAGDHALRDRRFEAWLAEPAQQQLIAEGIEGGWCWRGGRWVALDGGSPGTVLGGGDQ